MFYLANHGTWVFIHLASPIIYNYVLFLPSKIPTINTMNTKHKETLVTFTSEHKETLYFNQPPQNLHYFPPKVHSCFCTWQYVSIIALMGIRSLRSNLIARTQKTLQALLLSSPVYHFALSLKRTLAIHLGKPTRTKTSFHPSQSHKLQLGLPS